VLSSLPGAPSESKTLAALASQGTRQGAAWIGLSVKSGPLGPFWSWDVSTNWAGSQPDESSSGSQIPAYGVAKGAAFDEYSPNNQAVAKITIGYSISAILSIKVSMVMVLASQAWKPKAPKLIKTPITLDVLKDD
jgi:hypothetical protein